VYLYTAVDAPCTRPLHTGRKHGCLHGHGRTMYMARARPCTQSVQGRGRPCTDCARPPSAVYKLCTRPYTGHAHGPSLSRTRPCMQPVRGKTRPGTRPVPDRVSTVYTAVHGPCTVYTDVFTARVHGRVRTMYTAHDPNTAVYTVMYPIHGRAYGPCTVHGP